MAEEVGRWPSARPGHPHRMALGEGLPQGAANGAPWLAGVPDPAAGRCAQLLGAPCRTTTARTEQSRMDDFALCTARACGQASGDGALCTGDGEERGWASGD